MIGELELKFLTEMAELHAAYVRGEVVTSEMVRSIGRKLRAHYAAQQETKQIFQMLEDGECT